MKNKLVKQMICDVYRNKYHDKFWFCDDGLMVRWFEPFVDGNSDCEMIDIISHGEPLSLTANQLKGIK